MPSAMLRRDPEGKLLFYIAKKDLEAPIVSVERDDGETWGGEIALGDGTKVYIDPVSPPPPIPTTLKFRRLD